jgi:hypothetical protein
MVIARRYLEAWLASAREVTTEKNEQIQHGLGWICPKIIVQEGSSRRFDFVSKTFFQAGTIKTLGRDLVKTMFNSRFYTGSDQRMRKDPALHKLAVDMSNLTFFSNECIFGKYFQPSLPKNFTVKQRATIETYLLEHQSIPGDSAYAYHRRFISMTNEFIYFMKWKHDHIVKTEIAYALLCQFKNRQHIIRIPTDTLATAMVGWLPTRRRKINKMNGKTNGKKKKQGGKLVLKRNKPVHYATNNRASRGVVPRRVGRPLYQSWIEHHHAEEFKYALGLFAPKDKVCERIPAPLPIATATASLRGTFVATANATGYLFVGMSPWTANVLNVYNAVGLGDNVAITWSASSIPTIMTATNTTSFRVVSAWLGGVDMSPALTRTGTITVGNIPFSEVKNSAATSDTLRDSLHSNNYSSQEAKQYRGGFYLPMDPIAQSFIAPGGSGIVEFQTPFFYGSALVASTTVNIEYCINYEYIPAVGQTDLLATSAGPVGSFENALTHAAEIQRVRETDAPNSHGYTEAIGQALNLNSVSGLAEYVEAGMTGFALGGPLGTVAAVGGVAAKNVFGSKSRRADQYRLNQRSQRLMIEG